MLTQCYLNMCKHNLDSLCLRFFLNTTFNLRHHRSEMKTNYKHTLLLPQPPAVMKFSQMVMRFSQTVMRFSQTVMKFSQTVMKPASHWKCPDFFLFPHVEPSVRAGPGCLEGCWPCASAVPCAILGPCGLCSSSSPHFPGGPCLHG